MNSFKLRFLGPILSLLIVASAHADQDPIPLIQWTPGDPPIFDFFFPNDIHLPPAVKVFQFVGTARSTVPAPTIFDILIYFDYVDATGATVLIPPPPFGYHNVRPADGLPYPIEAGPYILPFCPQQVSIHFEITSEVPIVFDGLYDHTCIPIPEPTSAALFGLACVWGVLVRRRCG
jgi:hypothetical protein